MKHPFVLVFLTGYLLCVSLQVWAIFPFDFGKKEIKTDYSQTVWDRIMLEQSVGDMRRGMGEMATASYQAAANSFAKAIIKNPTDALPHFLYGASLYWSGKVEDAMSEYREGLRLEPNNPMGYQLLGIAWGWKGDIAQAQENFERAARLNPYKADTHMNLGSTYAAQKKFEQALDEYRRAVELMPREPLYHYQLGTLFDFMGRDGQAETSYKKALKYFAHYEDAQLALAALYEKRERKDEALKYYKKAIRTKPGDFVARLRYAYLLLEMGRKSEAREVIEGAFSIAPFKEDGLALNAVYRASGSSAEDFAGQIQKFQENLLKVPAAKDIQVQVQLDYEPTAAQPEGKNSGKFAEAYQSLRSSSIGAAQSPMSFQRSFVLNATDAKQRSAQVQELVQELHRAATAGGDKYQVNMTLQGRTMDFASPTALTQNRTTTPKAVYDPRIVGNDMGLWVMGKTWVRYVEEIRPELQEKAHSSNPVEYTLLQGLAALLAGQANAAAAAFTAAQQRAPTDILPLLGLGTAAVINADDSAAASYYRQALTQDAANKTARRNLKILEK